MQSNPSSHTEAEQAFGAGGGEEEDRTPDLRIANATLSQLSYPPTGAGQEALDRQRKKYSQVRRPMNQGFGGGRWGRGAVVHR